MTARSKTTRAVDSSGHARDDASSCVNASRAIPDNSQSSGSDTLESGRERRRRGKLKMLQRISFLESQLKEKCQRIEFLTNVITHLSATASRGEHLDRRSGPTHLSAEFFDLYGDMDASTITHAATQTEISVDLHSPDVFVRVQDLPAHADAARREADAAAGLRFRSSLDGDTVGSKPGCEAIALPAIALPSWDPNTDFSMQIQAMNGLAVKQITSTPDGYAADSDLTRQALDDVHAKHRVRREPHLDSQGLAGLSGPLADSHHDVNAGTASSKDFNSQSLAFLSGPSAIGILAQHPHDVGSSADDASAAKHTKDFNSQNLAMQSGSAECVIVAGSKHQIDHSHLSTSPDGLAIGSELARQALDDDHAKHRASDGPAPCIHHLGANANASTQDFNSQSLALMSRPSALEIHAQHNREEEKDLITSSVPQRGPVPQQAEDSSGYSAAGAWNPPKWNLACQSGPLGNTHLDVNADATSKDFNSQSLAHMSGPSAIGIHAQHVLDDGSSAVDASAATSTKDFNSQDLASLSGSAAVVTIAGSGHSTEHSSQASEATQHSPSSGPPGITHLDVNADASSIDFNSQSLAYQPGPSAIGIHVQHSQDDGASAVDTSAAKSTKDFNSQDLALQSGSAEVVTIAGGRHTAEHSDHFDTTLNNIDVNAGASSKDFNSQSLAFLSGPSAIGIHAQHSLDVVSSAVGASAAKSTKDINSQDLALQSRSAEVVTIAGSQHSAAHTDNYDDALNNLVSIFLKRRKPTRATLQATARAIHFTACKAGIDLDGYSDLLHAKSPLLWQEIFCPE